MSKDNNLAKDSYSKLLAQPQSARINQSDAGYVPGLPGIAFCLLLGVCFLQLQPDLYTPVWVGSELLVFLPVSIYLFYCLPKQRLIISFFVGYLWSLLFAHVFFLHQLPEELTGHELVVQGVISSVAEVSDTSVRFNFDISSYAANVNLDKNSAKQLPSRVRLSWYYHKQALSAGDRWQFVVKLKNNHGMQNPGGFDYEKWLYQKGIHATGYIRKNPQNKLLEHSVGSINGYRQKLIRQIEQLENQRFTGILQALTVGHKTQINPRQWQVLRDTGTSHLMAISGLHIGLVAAIVFIVVRRITPAFMIRYISSQQLAAVLSLFVALFYAMLAGFSVPTQRAFVMLVVFMLAILLKKPAFSLNTLSLSVIAVLIFSPLAVLTSGFWLSYLAVLIIVVVSSGRIYLHKPGPARWLMAIRLQWLIALAMLPLSLLLFNQGSLISPVANMLVIPVVAMFVVPLSLLASVFSLLSSEMSLWVFSLANQLISFIWFVLKGLSDFELSSWATAEISLFSGLLGICGLVLLLMPKGFPLRLAGFILLLPMLFQSENVPEKGEFWLTVIDVGQGLSVLIQTRDKVLLYDAGAKHSEHFDLGARVIVPYLQYRGIQQIDKFIISHADNDHAGGAESVLQGVSVNQLYSEAGIINPADFEHVSLKTCEAGDRWQWSGVNFLILHPQLQSGTDSAVHKYRKTNNRSCVIKVWSAKHSVLLSGDIERKVENKLLENDADKLASDVLIVPHHGSNTSSSPGWLKQVNPKLAIVSSGYKNRFKHPTQKVIRRYQHLGASIMNTAEEGAIHIKLKPDLPLQLTKLRGQRKVEVHYWNHGF